METALVEGIGRQAVNAMRPAATMCATTRRAAVRAPMPEQAQPQTGAGPVILDHDPNQRIREQEERNMAKRKAELHAEARARWEYEERVRNAPLTVKRCDRFGCQTNKGYAPRTD